MSTSLTFSRQVPVRHEVDVFVAGGGAAGCAAALAAASQGASTCIVEGDICFGGMGTSGGLPMLCSFSDGVNFVCGGVGREIHDRLVAAGGTVEHPLRRSSDLYIHPESLKLVLDELLGNRAGLTCYLATRIVGIEHAAGRISHVICHGKSGLFAVRAGAVVDASGDGDICAWAGAPWSKGDALGRMQPGTLISMWAGIDWPRAEAAGCGLWKQSGRLAEAIADGVFTCRDPGMPGIQPTGRTIGNGNVGHLFGVDGTDERSLTAAAMLGRRQIQEYGAYFRRYLTGYEGIELCSTAARVGIRETRRIRGDYELGVEDFRSRAVFADEIGRFAYAVDLHPTTLAETEDCHRAFERLRLGPGESYGIPYRILTPVGLANVLSAGRCVSADRAVLGSLRVIPGAFITGQAAGVAAAMAARDGGDVHGLAVPELQRRLQALGAWLPNRGEPLPVTRNAVGAHLVAATSEP